MTRILLFSLAVCLMSSCQRKMIPAPVVSDEIPPNVRIEGTMSSNSPCEPSIAIHPDDPDKIVAGAILDRVYTSADGGHTWMQQQLTSPYGVFGDPVLMADYRGSFYYAHLSNPSGLGWSDDNLLDRIVIQRSDDNGATWNGGSYTEIRHPKDQDKQWLAADPNNHHIYIAWTEFDLYGSKNPADKSRILFAKSTDHAESWSTPVAINQFEGDCLDDDDTVEGSVPAVGPNGEVYIAWSYNEKIYFDRSLDGGATWLTEDKVVADQPGGWTYDIPGIFRCNGLPVTLCDRSAGPHRGTIYVNWSDQRHGEEDTDIWVAKSTDQGTTWSAPVRVNDDGPGKQQFFSWMTVDQSTGYLYCVFYDRRAYDDKQTDVFLATSTDGGQTWSNQRISERPFRPSKMVFFGDYNHISAVNGRIRPIWTRLDESRLSVWTALIGK